jgi:hypothetical protein
MASSLGRRRRHDLDRIICGVPSRRSWLSLATKTGFLLGFGLLIALPGRAQQAQISGFVEDPTGAKVEGAAINVVSEETQAQRQTVSNPSGFYSIPNLPPGHYRMEVEAQGFQKVNRTDITLAVAQSANLDFRLQLAATAETVTVSGDVSPVNTTDGSVGMAVNRDLVENLPLNGRSFQSLITLSPGVTLSPSAQSFGQFVVNGQRATSNYLTVDGVNATTTPANISSQASGNGLGYSALGGTNGMVSLDALQEFRILTSTYAPEFGRTPGGQVILQTRSGSNVFHGTLFEYLRNDKLNANDWFANSVGKPRSPERFNNFGGTLGGPILRASTFFLFSYEGQRLVQPKFGVTAVPNLASRQAAPVATQPILKAFPVPNGPELGNNQAQFSSGFSNPLTSDAFFLRLDHVFTPQLRIFGTYNYAPSKSSDRGALANSSPQSLSSLQDVPINSQSGTAGATYVITPLLVNELRLAFGESELTRASALDTFGGAVPLPDSLPGGGVSQNTFNLGFPNGRLFQGSFAPAQMRQINVVDSIAYTKGTHQLKLGVDYRRLLPISGGNKSSAYTFNNVAGVVNNSVTSFTNSYTGPIRGDLTNLSVYAQDSWRLSSRLSVTYGLRWELNTPPRNRVGNNGNYVPLLGNYTTGAVEVGSPGVSLWDTQFLSLAPRLGAAYQLRRRAGRETVLRAGAGLFYDLGIASAGQQPWGNGFPNFLSTALANVSFPVSASQAVIPPADLSNPPAGSTFFVYSRERPLPRAWQWNFALQQSLGNAQTVTVSYVAALGRRLLYQQYYRNVSGKRYLAILSANAGTSDYHSLQIQYQRRLTRGLSATGGYTWGHSIDTNSSDFGTLVPTDYLGGNANRGPSDFDIRHALHGAISYSIPGIAHNALLGRVTQGWGLDTIFTAQSGIPIEVSQSRDVGYGAFPLRPDLRLDVPLWIADPNVAGGRRINSSAFATPAARQGNLGRNALLGFGLTQVDLSGRRTFRVTDRMSLLFRADIFNILNHANFANPTSTIGSGFFGQSTSMANSQIGGGAFFGLNSLFQVGGPRSLQLSLKAQF